MIALIFLVLINDLQPIIVDMFFINQVNIFSWAIITMQNLYMICLDFTSFFYNTFIFIRNAICKKLFPLAVWKNIIIN